MSDLFDTSSVRDDPEHWEALAGRIADRAARGGSVAWLAHSRVGWVGACGLLAASILFLAFGRRTAAGADDDWSRVLVPADPAARAVLTREAPPRIDSLLFSMRAEAR